MKQEKHWDKTWKIWKTKTKYLEIETIWFGEIESWFQLNIAWTRRMDHAGFLFRFEICKLYFSFNIYDCRHWNYDAKCFHAPHSQEDIIDEFNDE